MDEADCLPNESDTPRDVDYYIMHIADYYNGFLDRGNDRCFFFSFLF